MVVSMYVYIYIYGELYIKKWGYIHTKKFNAVVFGLFTYLLRTTNGTKSVKYKGRLIKRNSKFNMIFKGLLNGSKKILFVQVKAKKL